MKKIKIASPPDRCCDCHHGRFDSPEDAAGYCWRYPPVWIEENGEGAWLRPVVDATETCGEFKHRLNS